MAAYCVLRDSLVQSKRPKSIVDGRMSYTKGFLST